jgi:subtilisin family serine protease
MQRVVVRRGVNQHRHCAPGSARPLFFFTCVAALIGLGLGLGLGLGQPGTALAAKAPKAAAAPARPVAARPVGSFGARGPGAAHVGAAPQPPHVVPQPHPIDHPAGVMPGQPHPPGPQQAAGQHPAAQPPGQHTAAQQPPGHNTPGQQPAQHTAGQQAAGQHPPGQQALGQRGALQAPGLGRGPAPLAGRPGLNGLARNGLPVRPFPGEAGFTGVPPRGETRFVSNEMIVHVGPDVTPQALNAAAQRLGLTSISSQDLSLSGGRLVHFRLGGGQQVADAVRALEAEKIGIAQPNYVFHLQQDAQRPVLTPVKGDPAQPVKGDPAQYVVGKLHLADAHGIASGANVLIAVIDSLVDAAHPDLAGSLAGQYDAVTAPDKPDEHGTGMTGAIVAHRRLLGIAPGARVLAIHAFSPNAQHPQQATTQNIIAGIDWAIAKGARVINMSFAGPYDPMLQLALKRAHDKGVALIAAAGNMGPQSPPLFPAADENVIAVTAVDENDRILPQANQGPHVALAAPGVNVLEAAPQSTYNFTTGTSVAAAHVSGVAALILERNPQIDLATLENALFSTARDLGSPGRDSTFGYGLVDPYRALNALEAKVAVGRSPPATTASANPKPVTVATTSDKLPVGAAALVSGQPAAPIGPATPAKPSPTPPPGKLAVSQLAPPVPAPAPVSLAPSAPAAGGDEAPAALERKRLACRQDAAAKGMRGLEMWDYVAVCLSEARLGCLKQAVAQKVRGPERRDFMNRCLLGS